MRAITYREYGGADVLRLEECPTPSPKDDELLVRVKAAALNPYDVHLLHGTPYLMRLSIGLRKPKVPGIGLDFAGVVESAGRNATKFRAGDAVFGGCPGALAEFLVIPEGKVARKPENLGFEQAGAVCVAALSALQALRDMGRLRAGEKVLINGAAGGVGTFAVQIAKHLGGEVTGVSSGRNTALVLSLGADYAIDYAEQDYTQSGARYDVILDNVGNHSFSANRRVLTPNGRYVMVGAKKGQWVKPVDSVMAAWLYGRFVRQEFGFLMARPNGEDLAFLAELMAQGKVTPVIDKRYRLSEAAEAMRYLETGRARGKVVILVD